MTWKLAGAAAAIILTVTACGTDRDERVSGGAAAGAATGAGIGALGGPVGALAGAGIGGAAGAVTGATTSPQDINLGEPPWSNPEVRTPLGDNRAGTRTARASRPAASPSRSVRDAQRALAQNGYNPGPVDGVIGTQTVQALRAYQRSNNIPESGQLDTRTRQALLSGSGRGGGTMTGTGTTATPAAGGRGATTGSGVGNPGNAATPGAGGPGMTTGSGAGGADTSPTSPTMGGTAPR
jgi:peptidoglycan hydrolase-like protein with peptidoglycan-binding domain